MLPMGRFLQKYIHQLISLVGYKNGGVQFLKHTTAAPNLRSIARAKARIMALAAWNAETLRGERFLRRFVLGNCGSIVIAPQARVSLQHAIALDRYCRFLRARVIAYQHLLYASRDISGGKDRFLTTTYLF